MYLFLPGGHFIFFMINWGRASKRWISLWCYITSIDCNESLRNARHGYMCMVTWRAPVITWPCCACVSTDGQWRTRCGWMTFTQRVGWLEKKIAHGWRKFGLSVRAWLLPSGVAKEGLQGAQPPLGPPPVLQTRRSSRLNCIKFANFLQLIRRKTVDIVVTRSHILKFIHCTKSAPDRTGRAYSASPVPLAGF